MNEIQMRYPKLYEKNVFHVMYFSFLIYFNKIPIYFSSFLISVILKFK